MLYAKRVYTGSSDLEWAVYDQRRKYVMFWSEYHSGPLPSYIERTLPSHIERRIA